MPYYSEGVGAFQERKAQTMRKEKATGNELVMKSSYFSLFAPGGKYHNEFMDIVNAWRGEKDLIFLGVCFASLGFICGKREERAKRSK